MEYLGIRVTHDDVKRIDKKTTSNKNIKILASWKEVHQFIGVVNYYHDMLTKLSHTLAPITDVLLSKKPVS